MTNEQMLNFSNRHKYIQVVKDQKRKKTKKKLINKYFVNISLQPLKTTNFPLSNVTFIRLEMTAD